MAETVKTPAGLGLFAASPTNMAWYLKRLASRTIGPTLLAATEKLLRDRGVND
jgi:hypothetical protein